MIYYQNTLGLFVLIVNIGPTIQYTRAFLMYALGVISHMYEPHMAN